MVDLEIFVSVASGIFAAMLAHDGLLMVLARLAGTRRRRAEREIKKLIELAKQRQMERTHAKGEES